MRYVCLLVLFFTRATYSQEPTQDQLLRMTPLEKNQAILSLLNLPADPVTAQTQRAGVVAVQRLAHKIPKPARQAFERAAKLSKAHKNAEAADELKRAISLDPDFAEAHTNLGVQYYLLNRPAEAEQALRRAIELDPASATAYANMAAVKILQQDPAAAEQFVRRALALYPRNPTAQRLLDQLRSQTAP